jgi:hypothetical protein
MLELAQGHWSPQIEGSGGALAPPGLEVRRMNANVVELPVLEENFAKTAVSECEKEFTQISESLQRRESLLAASAKASRLLLEAPDVRAVVPNVLRLIGESAGVDRVNLMLSQAGPGGEPCWLLPASGLQMVLLRISKIPLRPLATSAISPPFARSCARAGACA